MKLRLHFLVTGIFCLCTLMASSQCDPGESEVTFNIICDPEDCDFTVSCYNYDGFESYYYDDITESGTYSFCLPEEACSYLYIYYNPFTLPDGMTYLVAVNGEPVAQGPIDSYYLTLLVNCPEGSLCGAPILLDEEGSYTASLDDTWYSFTPTETGLWNISTCGTNACDTKIWVYENCPWQNVEGPEGTYLYNDNNDCDLMANTDIAFEANHTYFIRIGDNMDNCENPINFTLTYIGLVQGCTDQTACNYNPLAQEDDGGCLYFPDPNCSSPDLVMNVDVLISSMFIMDVQSTTCDIEEGMVTGDGTRTVLTFSVRIDNIGEEDYYIGDPTNNPEMFETQNCHGHVHYAGYGDYRLMDMEGNIIPAGHKNGFCVMDLCGFGQYNCGMMGISAGCYDQYGAGTQGQWFDLTDVPDGLYYGLVTVNPLHLPDALGRQEMDYDNNTYTFCMEITTNGEGEREYQLLGDGGCPAYVDCMGVENGTAEMDCNGDCNGSAIWGDVAADNDLNNNDISQYLDFLEQETIDVTTCNDLSGNGSITIYDIALGNICYEESEMGGTASCEFPHNLLSNISPVGLAITAANFDEGYIDIEIKSSYHDIIAYQFTIGGIVIESVESLTNPNVFNCTMGFNPFTNSVFGLGEFQDKIENNNLAQNLCRIHFSQIISNTICIEGITDIVNAIRSRTASYVYGNCIDATLFSVGEINPMSGTLSIAPNPSTGEATISMNKFAKQPKQLVVRDETGRIVKLIAVVQGNHTILADFGELPRGVYTIRSEDHGILTNVLRFTKL